MLTKTPAGGNRGRVNNAAFLHDAAKKYWQFSEFRISLGKEALFTHTGGIVFNFLNLQDGIGSK